MDGSNGYKEFVPCLKGASGSFKSYQPAGLGHHAGCSFKDAQSGGYTITGTIICNKITDNTPVDGLVVFTHDFVFTGTVTCSGLI